MLDNAIEEFKKYTAKYDLNIVFLNLKYYHTFRVVDYAKKILESLTNNKYIIELGCIAALLHDIARFEQYTLYKTYNDSLSFDHGLKGYEILKENNYILNYVKRLEEQEIIFNSTLKHNKKDLELTNNYLIDVISRVVRDADKIDIMITQSNDVYDQNYKLNNKLLKDLLNNRSCDYRNVVSRDDRLFCALGFVFDINYKESFIIIKESKIVDKKIMELKKYNNDPIIDRIQKEINEYIDKKIGDDRNVR